MTVRCQMFCNTQVGPVAEFALDDHGAVVGTPLDGDSGFGARTITRLMNRPVRSFNGIWYDVDTDPLQWIEALPEQYNGIALRAALVDDNSSGIRLAPSCDKEL